MPLEIRRLILFTADLPTLTAFYRDVVGLTIIGVEDGWAEFDAGACSLALHSGRSAVGARSPKLVFYADDVAAVRQALIGRGLTGAGPVKSAGVFDLCDCRDPDGNRFQLSSRH